jgi:hypothetical protein
MRLCSTLAVVSLVGCATLSGQPASQGVPHQTTLPLQSPPGTTGIVVAQGPLTLVQASYLPTRGGGHAVLWTATDPSCPPVAEMQALARIDKFSAWYGEHHLAPGRYLCASHTQNESEASLTWITAQ